MHVLNTLKHTVLNKLCDSYFVWRSIYCKNPHLYLPCMEFLPTFTMKNNHSCHLFQLSHRFHRRSRIATLHWSAPCGVEPKHGQEHPVTHMPSATPRKRDLLGDLAKKVRIFNCFLGISDLFFQLSWGVIMSLAIRKWILTLHDIKGHHYLSPNVSKKTIAAMEADTKESPLFGGSRSHLDQLLFNLFWASILIQNHQEFADDSNTF